MTKTTTHELRLHLESWIQLRYGPQAALTSKPSDGPNGGTAPPPPHFTWLAIAAGHGSTPTLAGIRALASTDDSRQFALIEYFSNQRTRRTRWCLDRFDNWERMIDL